MIDERLQNYVTFALPNFWIYNRSFNEKKSMYWSLLQTGSVVYYAMTKNQ